MSFRAMILAFAATAAVAISTQPPVQALGLVDWASDLSSPTVATSMRPGQEYPVKCRTKNMGGKAWQPSDVTMLAWWEGSVSNQGKGFDEKVTKLVPTLSTDEVSGKVTAPIRPGAWTLKLRMAQDGKQFGETISQKIEVLHEYDAQVTGVTVPSKVEAGKKASIKIRVRNTGASEMDHNRLVLQVEVLRATGGGNIDSFLGGDNISQYKMSKVLGPGDTVEFTCSVQPKRAGEYRLSANMFDLEERDEVGRVHGFTIKVQ